MKVFETWKVLARIQCFKMTYKLFQKVLENNVPSLQTPTLPKKPFEMICEISQTIGFLKTLSPISYLLDSKL